MMTATSSDMSPPILFLDIDGKGGLVRREYPAAEVKP